MGSSQVSWCFVGVHEKPELKKKKSERSSVAAAHPQAVPASKPSADQIRQSVKQSLKEILMKRCRPDGYMGVGVGLGFRRQRKH